MTKGQIYSLKVKEMEWESRLWCRKEKSLGGSGSNMEEEEGLLLRGSWGGGKGYNKWQRRNEPKKLRIELKSCDRIVCVPSVLKEDDEWTNESEGEATRFWSPCVNYASCIEYEARMKANLSWWKNRFLCSLGMFHLPPKFRGLVLKFGDIIKCAGWVVTEWELKLNGLVCSVKYQQHICRQPQYVYVNWLKTMISSSAWGDEKNSPPLIEYSTCRPLRVLRLPSSGRRLVLFVVCGLTVVLCRDVRATLMLPIASSNKSSSASLWEIEVTWIFFSPLLWCPRTPWLLSADRFVSFVRFVCFFCLPVEFWSIPNLAHLLEFNSYSELKARVVTSYCTRSVPLTLSHTHLSMRLFQSKRAGLVARCHFIIFWSIKSLAQQRHVTALFIWFCKLELHKNALLKIETEIVRIQRCCYSPQPEKNTNNYDIELIHIQKCSPNSWASFFYAVQKCWDFWPMTKDQWQVCGNFPGGKKTFHTCCQDHAGWSLSIQGRDLLRSGQSLPLLEVVSVCETPTPPSPAVPESPSSQSRSNGFWQDGNKVAVGTRACVFACIHTRKQTCSCLRVTARC